MVEKGYILFWNKSITGNHITRRIKKLSINILLSFMKALIFLKKILLFFSGSVLYKPIRAVLRFFFYNVVVKFYRFYLYATKSLGFSRFNRNIVRRSFFANHKINHIFVIALTCLILFFNITSSAKIQSVSSLVNGTILSKLVGGEFSGQGDNELVEEFFNQISSSLLSKYRYVDNFPGLEDTTPLGTDANDQSDYDALSIVHEGSALVRPDLVSTTKVKRDRTSIVYHEVASGETISTIAENYDVSVNTILWENNLTVYSVIRPGDKLAILPFTGISYKIVSGDSVNKLASKYSVAVADILSVNSLTSGNQFKIGQNILIPGGRKILNAVINNGDDSSDNITPTRIAYSGLSVIKNLIKKPGVKPVGGNMMNWPTVGHRITQYYSWRHTGLDIANHVGTPIYAADAGTVEYVGWGNGYGQQIVVNHGGGKKTRYAHLSAYGVKKGQKVGKGEYIAAMGSTGWSTGPHLHFEVIINGSKYNPLGYIK